jgi:hypothetical protein
MNSWKNSTCCNLNSQHLKISTISLNRKKELKRKWSQSKALEEHMTDTITIHLELEISHLTMKYCQKEEKNKNIHQDNWKWRFQRVFWRLHTMDRTIFLNMSTLILKLNNKQNMKTPSFYHLDLIQKKVLMIIYRRLY